MYSYSIHEDVFEVGFFFYMVECRDMKYRMFKLFVTS